MDDIKKWIDETAMELKQERDELRVKLALAKMEAEEEWAEIEEKLAALDSKGRQLRKETAESAKDIGAAAKRLVGEIRTAFKKVTQKL